MRLPGSMPAAAHAGAAAAGAAASRRRGRVQASRAADTNSAALPAPLPVRRRTAKNPVVHGWSEDAGLPRTAGFRSRVWRVRGPGDVGDEGDSFERRVRFIETELRGCTDYDASQISTDDIAAELVRCRGHAGRAMRSLLPKKPPAGSTVEADRENAEDQPVLPEFMVAKITGLTTDRELQARRDTEIEMKWKMIDKSGNEDITLADFRILLAQLGIEKTDEDAEVVFQEIDADGNGGIDITEFEHWCVRAPTGVRLASLYSPPHPLLSAHTACVTAARRMNTMARLDPRYASGLDRLGERRGWANIKIPAARKKELAQYVPSRALKFLDARAKVKPSSRCWIEVIGSRLSLYDSDDKVVELARLQLSDPEVENCTLGEWRAEGWGDDKKEGGGGGGGGAGGAAGALAGGALGLVRGGLNAAEKVASTGIGLATGGGGQQKVPHEVLEIWLRMSPDTELYRVAVDLSQHMKPDSPSTKAWVESVSMSISHKESQRTGAQLWDSLAKRLKLVVQLQKQYGDIHEMYGSSSSVFEVSKKNKTPWVVVSFHMKKVSGFTKTGSGQAQTQRNESETHDSKRASSLIDHAGHAGAGEHPPPRFALLHRLGPPAAGAAAHGLLLRAPADRV